MTDANIEKAKALFTIAMNIYGRVADNAYFGDASEWTISFENLKTNIMGLCYVRGQHIKINANHPELQSWDQLKDTVLHECAHAFAGIEVSKSGRVMAHGKLWKQWASRLGAKPIAKHTSKITDQDALIKHHSQSKYILAFIKDGTVEVVSSCNRRLKNLHRRCVPNRKETFGHLYHVVVSDFINYKDDCELLKLKAFQ